MATARNLVTRPAFRAGGPASPHPWQAAWGGAEVAALEDSLEFRQVDRNRPGVAIELPGEVWEEGAQYRVTLTGIMDATNYGYTGVLLPAARADWTGASAGGGPAAGRLEVVPAQGTDKAGQWFTGTAVLTIPTGYVYDLDGNPFTPPAGGPVFLAIARQWPGKQRIRDIRAARLPDPLEGYFDGDTPDGGGWTYAWDGDPFVSTSTATDGPAPDPDPDPEPEPELEPVPELVVGTPATYPVWQVAGSPEPEPVRLAGIPDGMADDGTHKRITGTPTTAGTFTVELQKSGDYGGWETYATVEVVVDPAPVDPDPEDPDPEDPEPGAGDPDPEDPEPGDGDPDPEDPEPGDGDPDPEDPDPEDPDPWDEWGELTTRLAPRVAAFVGRPGDEDATSTAAAQLPLVAEYVRGYTRGRGFDGGTPAGPLLAVIVSATARLATNPEQVSAYTMGDYSERPARLAGWTLAEIGVLHRYRVVSA